MPWPTISDPVPATVITAAWEIANPLAAVRWLRQLMGNTDPPGSGAYVVVSSSSTAAAWAKVPSDALAFDAARQNLGYTPVNKAGDVNVGALSLDGDLTMTNSTVRPKGVAVGSDGIANAGPYAGGSVSIGTVSVLGEVVGLNGISCAGPVVATGGIATNGAITPAIYAGGSVASGSPQMLGLTVGLNGISCAGPIVATGAVTARGSLSVLAGLTAATYGGGSTASGGTVSVQGLATGSSGIAAGGPVDATAIRVSGVDVYSPSNPPPSVAVVPPGAIVAFDTAAHLTAAGAGWTPHTAADGRLLVGSGTSFSQTFTAGTAYGAAWTHAHATSWASHTHGSSALSVSGSTGAASGASSQVNVSTPNPAVSGTSHTHDQGTLDVGGNTDPAGGGGTSPDTWLPPSLGVAWGRKL